jgi:hypothetical protein
MFFSLGSAFLGCPPKKLNGSFAVVYVWVTMSQCDRKVAFLVSDLFSMVPGSWHVMTSLIM